MKKLTTEQFIEKSKMKHGDRYDYCKTNYISARSPVNIICQEHGVFTQNANDHMNGYGCPHCGGTVKLTSGTVVEKFKAVHGDKYDYSGVVYKNAKSKVSIICRQHGEFKQIAHSHMNGHGCPECRHEKMRELYTWDNEKFSQMAKAVHGEKYDYSKTLYLSSMRKVEIICHQHGSFFQRPDMHINQMQGCPSCAVSKTSRAEIELADFISSLGFQIKTNDRLLISPQEIDVLIPSLKIAIEFNGLYWHGEHRIEKDYHLSKRKKVEEKGYRLISIREDLWHLRKEQICNMLRSVLGLCGNTVYARKCTIAQVSKHDAEVFFDTYHPQSSRNASQYWGLKCDGELVSCMSVTDWKTKKEWEIVRFATSCNVPGGLSKLWAHIRKVNNVITAYSYVDRDLFTGTSYVNAGFQYHSTTIGFRIVVGKSTQSRQKWNKSPDGLSQTEWYKREGVFRIYDSGQDKLIWKK